jgi:hypothetical protein
MTAQGGSKTVSDWADGERVQDGTHGPANSLAYRAKFGPRHVMTRRIQNVLAFLLWLAIVVAVLDGWWLR